MILTPLSDDQLPRALAAVGGRLPPGSVARAALDRIAATTALLPLGVDLPHHRAQAVALAHTLGIPTIDEEPAQAWSYDGHAIRTRSEAYVVIHEIAHWLICPPVRRGLLDFGLGRGPESGRVAEADAARCVDQATQIAEEEMASLLGILWEVELGHPAVAAFVEQNWLEGWDRPACAENFSAVISRLYRDGHLDGTGRPRPGLASHTPLGRAVGFEDCLRT